MQDKGERQEEEEEIKLAVTEDGHLLELCGGHYPYGTYDIAFIKGLKPKDVRVTFSKNWIREAYETLIEAGRKKRGKKK